MKKLGRYFLARAQEASTWRALVMLACGLFALNRELVDPVVNISLLLSGAVGVLFPDEVGGKK